MSLAAKEGISSTIDTGVKQLSNILSLDTMKSLITSWLNELVSFCVGQPMQLCRDWSIVFGAALTTAHIRKNKRMSAIVASVVVTTVMAACLGAEFAGLALLGSYFAVSNVLPPLRVPLVVTGVQSFIALLISALPCDYLLHGIGGRVGLAAVCSTLLMKRLTSFIL